MAKLDADRKLQLMIQASEVVKAALPAMQDHAHVTESVVKSLIEATYNKMLELVEKDG